MVAVQTVLGGVTRLTDSGLSITEWQPILGVIPPLSEAAWQEAFEKYQAIPQFEAIHSKMELPRFKFIYFWEWFHRLWGRLLGFAFVVPLVVFALQKRLAGRGRPLTVLLLLGLAQGVLGWYMVKSGLTKLVYVSHLRLTAHFLLALVLLAALIVYGARELGVRAARPSTLAQRRATLILAILLTAQLALGALSAGLKAALFAPTWPTILGSWVVPLPLDFWNHPLPTQFLHRMLAYALVLFSLYWMRLLKGCLGWERYALLLGLILQTALGVAVVLRAGFRDDLLLYGALHQFLGLGFVALVALSWVKLRNTASIAPKLRV